MCSAHPTAQRVFIQPVHARRDTCAMSDQGLVWAGRIARGGFGNRNGQVNTSTSTITVTLCSSYIHLHMDYQRNEQITLCCSITDELNKRGCYAFQMNRCYSLWHWEANTLQKVAPRKPFVISVGKLCVFPFNSFIYLDPSCRCGVLFPGITIYDNKIYQLTWQNNVCFVYDLDTLEQVSWGISPPPNL